MSDEALWGALLLIYILLSALWQINEWSTDEARKQLSPGRAPDAQRESRTLKLGLLWCTGLAGLLAAWKAGWYPIPAFVVMFIVTSLVFGVTFLIRHRRRLVALTAPIEGQLISRFEIILLWLGGMWAILVFTESNLLHDQIRESFVRGVFIGWIPLALIAITRRFWR